MTVPPWTYERDAIIDIGEGTFINGAHANALIGSPRAAVLRQLE